MTMYTYVGWISLFCDVFLEEEEEEERRVVELRRLLSNGLPIFESMKLSIDHIGQFVHVFGGANRSEVRREELLKGLQLIAECVPSAIGSIYDFEPPHLKSDPQSGRYKCFIVRRGSVTVLDNGLLPPMA